MLVAVAGDAALDATLERLLVGGEKWGQSSAAVDRRLLAGGCLAGAYTPSHFSST
jgi:hypothetical protein